MATSPRIQHPIGGRFDSIGLAIGSGSAVLLAGVLVPTRATVGTANIALLLCGIVVLAALTSRLAGIGTAVIAALSFNFFHTRPYQSLRISDGRDIATVCLLVFVGIVVSWIGEWRRRTAHRADMHRTGEHSLETVIAMIARGDDTDLVSASIRSALVHDLRLADCRFEARSAATTGLTRIDRHGSIVSHHLRLGAQGFELPASGAAVDVASGGVDHGQMVLLPGRDGSPVSIDQRRAAIALIDLYALALERGLRATVRVST